MNRFLQLLSRVFKEFLPKKYFDRVLDDEKLCHYIFSSRHFSKAKKSVKYAAFMPKNGQTSVFRVTLLSVKEIWDIGINHVQIKRGDNIQLKARADLFANLVRATKGLDVVSETSMHPLHANLVNWPTGRDDQILAAIELANGSSLNII